MYNTVNRLSAWQAHRDSKTEVLKREVEQERMKACTFTPVKMSKSRLRTDLPKCERQTRKCGKEARLAAAKAREKRQMKEQVPHATGQKWTGRCSLWLHG